MAELTWRSFPRGTKLRGDTHLLGIAPPSSFRFVLLDGTVSVDKDKIGILSQEIREQHGYQRQLLNWNEGVYREVETGNIIPESSFTTVIMTNQNKVEVHYSHDTFMLTAVGGQISFNAVAVISNAHPLANKPVESVDNTTDQITVTNHQLSVGDQIFFTGTGLIPGLTTLTLYWVKEVLTENTFKISLTQAGSVIDITGNLSGDLLMRYANGEPEILANYEDINQVPITQIILPGDSREFTPSWTRRDY